MVVSNEEEFNNFVMRIALENAISFKGKANPKALIGKIIPKFPDMKNNMGDYMKRVNNIVEDINSMSLEEQKNKLLELDPNFSFEKKEKKIPKKSDGLPELEGTENGVVVRFEPAPSGHLHIGHLFPLIANYGFKKKYGGKFILRIADTNPDNIDISNYEKVIDDVKWITNNSIDELVYQSDRMDIYYKYLRTLVELGHAYVCHCDPEVFKNYTDNKDICPCNSRNLDVQIEDFNKFMEGKFEQGSAVIRFKADHTHKNPAMRSFSLARINHSKHARVGNKYFVWPTMHLAVAIDDALMGITHVIRGKDHEINMERQKLIHRALGLKSPSYFHMGRMKFEDLELSKSKLTIKIENGEFTGWDDPRVPSILAYKKRGYRAEAFYKFILSLGISKRDSKITSKEFHKGLDYFNKQILEIEANRYFLVRNPKKVSINNLAKFKLDLCKNLDFNSKECNYLKLPKHPEDKSRGFREIKIESEYLIDEKDFNELDVGDLFRLMHFANFKIIEKDENEMIIEFESIEFNRELKIKKNIQFVSYNDYEDITMILPNNNKILGKSEKIPNLKIDSSIQFERIGFVRFDSVDNNRNKIYYFTHK